MVRFTPMQGHSPPIFPAVRVVLGTRTRTCRGASSRPDAQRIANRVARCPYGVPLRRRMATSMTIGVPRMHCGGSGGGDGDGGGGAGGILLLRVVG